MTKLRSGGALAAAAVLGTGLMATGCGGGSDESGSSKPATIQSVPTNAQQTTARVPKKAKSHAKKKGAESTPAPLPPGSSLSSAAKSAVSRLPGAKRKKVVGQTARLVLKTFGLRVSSVAVGPGGTSVKAVVSAAGACKGTPRTEALAASRLRDTVPFVTSFGVSVGGTGQSLSQYVSGHCRTPRLPGGRGRVVFSASGAGITTTRSFTVHSRHWTVDYVNAGSFLSILVLKGSQPTGGAVTSVKRGAGRQSMSGSGTFRLKVAGGEWTVRVRDG